MLKEVRIINYKCFEDNTIFFKDTNNIIIGENNAGKSTLLEVLRIINNAIEKLKVKYYNSSKIEYGLGIGYKGIYMDLEELDIETENIFYKYEEKPIEIVARFANEVEINIYILDKNRVFAFADIVGVNIKSNVKFKELFKDKMAILPQISLLKKEERIIQERNTKKNINTKITSLHFRNEILLYKNQYPEIYKSYVNKITESWKEIALEEIDVEEDFIYIIMRDYDFSIEVGKMGAGVQMWLQMLWFFTKNMDSTAIILDEPDVYLHPELQKRIIKIAKEYNKQLIISTHSVEIISEVDKSEIIILDKHKDKTRFVHELFEIQDVLDKLGSSQIVKLVKLDKYNRIICVEGEDINLLNIWHKTLFPQSDISFNDVPSYKTGGWGSWDIEKIRAEKILKEREEYNFYYIYDKDYHSEKSIADRYSEAQAKNINIHIWTKKEIENYLINLDVIYRKINKEKELVSKEKLREIINEICDETKEKVIGQYFNEACRQKENRSKEGFTLFKEIEKIVNEKWEDWDFKLSVVPGKEVMKKLKNKIKMDYNVQLSNENIAKEFKKSEIPTEIAEVINKIETKSNFAISK